LAKAGGKLQGSPAAEKFGSFPQMEKAAPSAWQTIGSDGSPTRIPIQLKCGPIRIACFRHRYSLPLQSNDGFTSTQRRSKS
jgi:hypothetical protein